VHVPVGLANIAREWWGVGTLAALWGARLFGLILLFTGLRAVWAVVMPGGGAT
jgi:fumarate reductase subunit C